ncbi:SNF1-related protein kinase regulatory subunit beta-1 [Impatiens glandulifera]|uniref:SNF1-related protein kinase regulatory subunit beta-1 n=1 Tax=Impatiens glandulifera TaxID=253017 RepID=UPI001FB11234|nr:SNF1-related protein kinase regulatory subunit beta-1 [Impatiens glandulifera]
MGNANGREDGTVDGVPDRSSGMSNGSYGGGPVSTDSMANSPPESPGRSRSPLMFAPQIPIAPLQRGDGPPLSNQMWQGESPNAMDFPTEQGIPTLLNWSYGGTDVVVEGSWDNWASRRKLQRSGKDHSILLVLPMGIYHYRFIVDGEPRYIQDLSHVADERGQTYNILDVNDYVPESIDGVAEFESPPSPESSYGQPFLGDEDFAKEPVIVPPQLQVTVEGEENATNNDHDNPSSTTSSKPQHVVLNHLFLEKGWASQSVVALGLTHRFQSKYVTVVLYKPHNKRS